MTGKWKRKGETLNKLNVSRGKKVVSKESKMRISSCV